MGRLWDVATGKLLHTFVGEGGASVIHIVFSPKGDLIAVAEAHPFQPQLTDSVRLLDASTFLPRMAAGETRGAFSMSEPELGSDVAAIRTRAVRNPDGNYTINGQKMWLTNGATSTLVAVLVRTDEGSDKAHRNLTAFAASPRTACSAASRAAASTR